MGKFFAFGVLSLILLLVVFDKLVTRTKLATTLLIINGITINAQIAQTPEVREKGLGGQNKLGEKEGMLFIMPSYQRHAFWMKGMKFPLDMIWIDKETIVDITKNVPRENSHRLTIYQPSKPVNFVLEVNAGFSDKYQIKIGDKVSGLIKFMIAN